MLQSGSTTNKKSIFKIRLFAIGKQEKQEKQKSVNATEVGIEKENAELQEIITNIVNKHSREFKKLKLSKPYSLDDIINTIYKLLTNKNIFH